MQSWIYIEPGEKLDPIVKQISARLRQNAPEICGTIKGIVTGTYPEGRVSELAGAVDELNIVEIPPGSEHSTEIVANILSDLMKADGPSMLFLGFTHRGMELAPLVGYRLGIPVTTGCVDFSFDAVNRTAFVSRLINRSKFVASFTVNMDRGAIFSLYKGSIKEAESETKGTSSVPVINRIHWRESWAARKTEVLGPVAEEQGADENITKANILVSVGRGIGSPDNIPMAKELAAKLGGMLSCSRPVVDNGWLPTSRQVGISGRTVSPLVYLALGISGQNNHLAGMDTSKLIIAVNKDAEAPIFSAAHYGVVDDVRVFVPELIKLMDSK